MREVFLSQFILKITEFLKKSGFKKSCNYFYKKNNNNWEVINIQKSKDNKSKFTFNTGIFLKTLGDFYQFDENRKLEIDDLHWKKRIGQFHETKSDLWFEINNNDHLHTVYQVVSKLFEEVILPKLENICDDSEMERIWVSNADSGTTEFLRLLNLTVLLCKREAENKNTYIEDLKEYAKKNKLSIEYHLKLLNVKSEN